MLLRARYGITGPRGQRWRPWIHRWTGRPRRARCSSASTSASSACRRTRRTGRQCWTSSSCSTANVTPGYSGHWPGYSGCGVSISIIWTSGPHNQLNGNYHSLSPSLSLSPVTSLPLTSLTSSPSPLSSRFRNLPFQLDSKAKGASFGVGESSSTSIPPWGDIVFEFLQEGLVQGTKS